MCGIAGSIGSDKIDSGRIDKTLQKLERRGPDSDGFQRIDLGNAQATILHTRLSIIDLHNHANQPFVRDGLTLAFNGEIYNYIEIAKELRQLGHKLETNSDTEVLLEAYRAWGMAALDKLEGMWAFALLDEKKRTLILSRDRFGEKPLFYTRRNGTTYFASEPKALAALTGEKFQVNKDKISRYLTNGFRTLFKADDTFFENVHEVPPAHNIVIDSDGAVQSDCYWQLRYQPQEMTPQDAVEGVYERLLQSMKLRLRSDVPLAFCLSGGVDSTALVSMAARELGAEIHAFSIIDSDERYDESRNIKTTVEQIGCDHYIAHTSSKGFFERMRDLVAYHDAPVPTISYYVHSFLSQEIAQRGYKVAISGTGADEIFTGYYDHYAYWLSEYAGSEEIEQYVAEWRGTYGRWVNNPLLQDPMTFHKQPDFRDHLYQNRDLFNGFLVEENDAIFSEKKYCGNLLRNRMMNELSHEIVPVILRADDMNSMRYSVENRSPFLDRNLVEFAYSIPNKNLIRDGLPKWPLRQAIKGIAPDSVRLDTQKRGFNASIDSLVDRSDPDTLEQLLSPSPIFDIVRRDVIEDFLSKDMTDNSFSKFMFSFISAKMFMEAAH